MLERRLNGGGQIVDIRIEIDKIDKIIERLLADEMAIQSKK